MMRTDIYVQCFKEDVLGRLQVVELLGIICVVAVSWCYSRSEKICFQSGIYKAVKGRVNGGKHT